MARYNEILVGRFNRGLGKLLSIKGDSPSPQVASEIMPVFPIALGTDTDFLFGIDTFGVSIVVGAVAAQLSFTQLFNPSTSGVIAEILHISGVLAAATDVMTIAIGPGTAQGAGATVARFDARTKKLQSIQITSGASAAPFGSTTAFWASQGPAGSAVVPLVPIPRIPLLPGDALIIAEGTVNSTIRVNLIWKERVIEDSEKGA